MRTLTNIGAPSHLLLAGSLVKAVWTITEGVDINLHISAANSTCVQNMHQEIIRKSYGGYCFPGTLDLL